MSQTYPVIVIGAGPVGLAAASHLIEREQDVLVLEAGKSAGAAMESWGHIKLFSSWQYNIDAAARRLLEAATQDYDGGWQAPRETRLPSGADMVNEYLAPLAAHPAMANVIRYGQRVVKVSRVQPDGKGLDKAQSRNREESLFLVRTESAAGTQDHLARAVIDASGTWGTPNPIGRSGIEAIGENDARTAGFITSPLPDPLDADAKRFAGKTVLVLGAGHSAANTLISLGRLRQRNPETTILWGLRGAANPVRLYGGGAADELPARGQLGTSLQRLVENGEITILEHVSVASLDLAEQLSVNLSDGRALVVDLVVPATGFRPDLAPLSELRLDLDQIVEAPRALGPLIDPEFHSCGTVTAHGERELAHPDKNFYIVGMKSYGRAPTFLMATGYEQVRSIAAALAGDRAAADLVELELPETGVCSTDIGTSCDVPAAKAAESTSCSTPATSDSNTCGAPAPVVESEAGGCCGETVAEVEPVADSCCGTAEPIKIGFATGTLHGHTELVDADKN